LEEDDPSAIERMISYLYTLDYDDGNPCIMMESGSESGDGVTEEVEGGGASETESYRAESDTNEPTSSPSNEDNALTVGDDIPENLADPRIANSLLGNVHVYSIADKYDMPELKELAKKKFLDQVHNLPSTILYPEIIRLIYEPTPSSDRGLRDAASQTFGVEIRTFMDDPTFSDVLKEIGDFGYDLLRESLKSDGDQLSMMLASMTTVQDELEETSAQLCQAKTERDQFEQQVQDAIKVVNHHEKCRHCDTSFPGRLENATTLRCGNCRTRHWAPAHRVTFV